MPSEKDTLRRSLGRLGRVPREVLNLSRQRVRGNLNADLRPTSSLPLPDASPADLTVLRRPFYIGGAMALVCLVIAGAAVVRSESERRSASIQGAKSTSTQTLHSQEPAQSPRITPAVPKPEQQPRTVAATKPRPPDPLPAQTPRRQVRFTLFPPGEGRVILDRACAACHRVASVGLYHYATRAQYAAMVSRMIAKGAQVSEEEAPVLTDYLFRYLADKSAPEPNTAGRGILERACTGCHDLNGLENYAYDSEEPYRELVSTMVSYGAILSEPEKTTLIQYLFTTYGKR